MVQRFRFLTNAPAQNYTEYNSPLPRPAALQPCNFVGRAKSSQWDLDNVSVTPLGTITPTITAISESPSSGDLNAGKTGTITWT